MLLNRLQRSMGSMDKSRGVVRSERSDLESITVTRDMEKLFVKGNLIEQVVVDPNGSGGSLRVLDLSENRISDVSELAKFRALEMLNLSENYLEDTLDLAKFKGMNKLRVLDLSYNDINYLDNTGDVNLESLEDLNLSHNNLITSDLDLSIFYPYTKLHTLRLNNSYLSSLEYQKLVNIKSLKTVYLNGNNFKCEFLDEMLQFLRENGIATPPGELNTCPGRMLNFCCTGPLPTNTALTTPNPTVFHNTTSHNTMVLPTNMPQLVDHATNFSVSLVSLTLLCALVAITVVLVFVAIHCAIAFINRTNKTNREDTTATQGRQFFEDTENTVESSLTSVPSMDTNLQE